MKMNQNLRDFSDRHFEVVFLEWLPRSLSYKHHKLATFERYEEASRFQKGLTRSYKKAGMGLSQGFPVGNYIRNYSVMKPYSERDWSMMEPYREREV